MTEDDVENEDRLNSILQKAPSSRTRQHNVQKAQPVKEKAAKPNTKMLKGLYFTHTHTQTELQTGSALECPEGSWMQHASLMSSRDAHKQQTGLLSDVLEGRGAGHWSCNISRGGRQRTATQQSTRIQIITGYNSLSWTCNSWNPSHLPSRRPGGQQLPDLQCCQLGSVVGWVIQPPSMLVHTCVQKRKRA